MAIDVVRLIGLGPLPDALEAVLAPELSRRISASCHWESRALDTTGARLPGREQVDADRLLAGLEARPVADGTIIVGVTASDIAIPIFTFVFGRARTPGHAALVSIARLDPAFYGLAANPQVTLRRTVDEILHELGHTAGLRHCQEAECLMRFAGSVSQVDARDSIFCVRCVARLPRGLAG